MGNPLSRTELRSRGVPDWVGIGVQIQDRHCLTMRAVIVDIWPNGSSAEVHFNTGRSVVIYGLETFLRCWGQLSRFDREDVV